MPEKKPVKKVAPKTKAAKTAKPKKAVKAAPKRKVAKKAVAAKPKTAASKTKTAPKAKAAKENKGTKFFSTGEKCPESGLYEHFCKDKGENARIPLSKTETFPPCRTCGSVKWVLVMAA